MRHIKSIILPNLHFVFKYLTTQEVNSDIWKYRDKIIVDYKTYTGFRYGNGDFCSFLGVAPSASADPSILHAIRIYRSNSVLDLWYDSFKTSNRDDFIAALDYRIMEDCIKIEYLNVHDEERSKIMNTRNFLDEYETQEMTRCLITYTENIAREHAKDQIKIDVHGNLRLYNLYYKNNGFLVTDVRCRDNPFWFETVKSVALCGTEEDKRDDDV
jgi:hypothetical protein